MTLFFALHRLTFAALRAVLLHLFCMLFPGFTLFVLFMVTQGGDALAAFTARYSENCSLSARHSQRIAMKRVFAKKKTERNR